MTLKEEALVFAINDKETLTDKQVIELYCSLDKETHINIHPEIRESLLKVLKNTYE